MNKKLIIVASIPLVVGAATLIWALDQQRQDREEIADYQSRYAAQADDFVKQYNGWLQMPPQERQELDKLPLLLDEDGQTKSREQLRQEQQGRFKANLPKLLDGEVTNRSLADLLYGENWQEELREYKRRRAFNKSVFIVSVVCTSIGGLIYIAWALLIVTRLSIKVAICCRGLAGRAQNAVKKDKEKEMEQEEEADADKGKNVDAFMKDERSESESDGLENKPKQRPKIPVKPLATSSMTTMIDRPRRPMGSITQRPEKTREEKEKTGVLIAEKKDEKSGVKTETHTEREPVRLDLNESPKPIDNTLNDLTQQVSAIREYAANQQDRLEKLQDGYDWNIIRTFCLRIIRCIDNIENRIARSKDEDPDTTALEEVKDELIFALESSGIERFEPKIDSEYRGQEKFAEAIKEKLGCEDPKQTGKIANVIRPGYQYFIDEENFKIVRPAQVQLYA